MIENSTISGNSLAGIFMGGSAQATILNNKIVNNKRYGVACYQQGCFDYAPARFEGAVRGSKNEISGNDVCPAGLEFLKTSAGGCYGQKC